MGTAAPLSGSLCCVAARLDAYVSCMYMYQWGPVAVEVKLANI